MTLDEFIKTLQEFRDTNPECADKFLRIGTIRGNKLLEDLEFWYMCIENNDFLKDIQVKIWID